MEAISIPGSPTAQDISNDLPPPAYNPFTEPLEQEGLASVPRGAPPSYEDIELQPVELHARETPRTTSPSPQQQDHHEHHQEQEQRPEQLQQQESVVVVDEFHETLSMENVQSFRRHAIIACIVLWFFNLLFGLAAFGMAYIATRKSESGRSRATARKLGHVSLGLSGSGIVVTFLLVVTVAVLFTDTGISSCRYHRADGSCYLNKTLHQCRGANVEKHCYSNDSCHPDYFVYDHICYKYRTSVSDYDYCSGAKSWNYCYSNSIHCPYHLYNTVCYRYKSNISEHRCYGVTSMDNRYCYSNRSSNDDVRRCCYKYLGIWYNYKSYVGLYGHCNGVRSSGNFCYRNTGCWFHAFNGICYKYKINVGLYGDCAGVKSGGYCYADSCPYHLYASTCYVDKPTLR